MKIVQICDQQLSRQWGYVLESREIKYLIYGSMYKLMNPLLLHKVGILSIDQLGRSGIGLGSELRTGLGVRRTKSVPSADLTLVNYPISRSHSSINSSSQQHLSWSQFVVAEDQLCKELQFKDRDSSSC